MFCAAQHKETGGKKRKVLFEKRNGTACIRCHWKERALLRSCSSSLSLDYHKYWKSGLCFCGNHKSRAPCFNTQCIVYISIAIYFLAHTCFCRPYWFYIKILLLYLGQLHWLSLVVHVYLSFSFPFSVTTQIKVGIVVGFSPSNSY